MTAMDWRAIVRRSAEKEIAHFPTNVRIEMFGAYYSDRSASTGSILVARRDGR